MTSLEMAGFSISVLKLSAETATVILNCLDAPCEALGWQHSIHKPSVDKPKAADPLKRTSEKRRGGGPANSDQAKMATAKSVDFACEALISCEQMLNTMDSGAGESTYLSFANSLLCPKGLPRGRCSCTQFDDCD